MATQIERVLVAGATGGTGQELLTQIRNTGVTVRALTRSAGNVVELERRGVNEVVVGDLFEPTDAVDAVSGCDAVLCAVGTAPGPRMITGPLVDRTGVSNLITAAIGEGVEHFVYESAIGVGSSQAGMALPFRLLIWRSLRAKLASENALRTSELTYTILRPGRLTNDLATGEVLAGEGGDTVKGSIPRADVARLMVAALFTPTARDRTFEVVSEGGERGDPSGLVDVDWRVPEATERVVG